MTTMAMRSPSQCCILSVRAAGERYPVVVQRAGWAGLGSRLRALVPSPRAVIITHPRIRRLHGAGLMTALRAAGLQVQWCEFPEGERGKSAVSLHGLYQRFVRSGVDRSTLIISFGGGVVGDVGGYAAATFMRGLPWVVLPSTLVAQLDSAVGGKVGINLPAGKNLVGAFYQPRLVFANLALLQTLPVARVREGGIEALKCGWIGDPVLARRLRSIPLAFPDYFSVVCAALRVKIAHVQSDVRDQHGRRIFLNLGHTVAHALERHGGYRRWTHGQGVAAGLIAAAQLSQRWGYCNAATAAQLCATVQRMEAVRWPRIPAATWQRLLRGEKKRRGQMLDFVALRAVARPVIHRISVSALAQDLSELYAS